MFILITLSWRLTPPTPPRFAGVFWNGQELIPMVGKLGKVGLKPPASLVWKFPICFLKVLFSCFKIFCLALWRFFQECKFLFLEIFKDVWIEGLCWDKMSWVFSNGSIPSVQALKEEILFVRRYFLLKSPFFWKELLLVQVVTYQVMCTGCTFLGKSSDPNLLPIIFYFGSPYEKTVGFLKKVVVCRCWDSVLGPSHTWISRFMFLKNAWVRRNWIFSRYLERSGPTSSGESSIGVDCCFKRCLSPAKRRWRSELAQRLSLPFRIRQSRWNEPSVSDVIFVCKKFQSQAFEYAR